MHEGSQSQGDKFSLDVTDGHFNVTKSVPVIIGLVNDQSPRMQVNKGLRVQAGISNHQCEGGIIS